MSNRRIEEERRLLVARRDALLRLGDDLVTLDTDLGFFHWNARLLKEHPDAAGRADLLTGIEALEERVNASNNRVWEVKTKVEAAIAAADAALASQAVSSTPLN